MKNLLLLSAIIFLSTGCGNNTSRHYNTQKSDEINIGVAYPASSTAAASTHFTKGIEFAVKTINSSGGVLGKKLNAVIRDDENNANVAMQIAQTFCNQGITAVIGHWSTNVSYYTQDIYEKNNVVMLTATSTGMILFEERFNYIFRITGSNQVFAQAIALHMAENNYKNTAIFFSEDEFGIDFAKITEKELNKQGIMVIDRVTNITPLNINAILNRWNAFGIDGVIMTASYPEFVEPIKLLRRTGSDLPVFGGDTFEEINQQDLTDGYFNSLYIAVLNQETLDTDFLEGFRLEYNHDPDTVAIAGYEAVMLLADAMEAVQSTDGTAIASYLSSLNNYKTISSVRTYNYGTQEFDGYNVHIAPLKSIIFGKNHE